MVNRGLALLPAACLVVGACAGGAGGAATTLPLRHVADVALPGGSSRFDYADVDPARHLLVVAHLGASEVTAVSLDQRRVEWTARAVGSAHGVRIDPKLGRVFATATGTNEVVALDESTGREVGRARTGAFPDGLAVDDTRNLLLVSDKNGGTVTALHADTLAPVATVDAGGDVGNTQVPPDGGHALVADGKDNELLTFDTDRLTETNRDHLARCHGAHGVALDPTVPRAYVACEDNATLVVVDLATHRQVTHLTVGDDPDVLAIDPEGRRLYVAAESGTVTVIALDPTPTVIDRAHLADGAHTVAVDPTLHLIAFALADVDGHPVLRLESPS